MEIHELPNPSTREEILAALPLLDQLWQKLKEVNSNELNLLPSDTLNPWHEDHFPDSVKAASLYNTLATRLANSVYPFGPNTRDKLELVIDGLSVRPWCGVSVVAVAKNPYTIKEYIQAVLHGKPNVPEVPFPDSVSY